MTAMNPFASIPSPSEGIDWKENYGALLILQPTAVETGIQTVHGPSDAVRANVWILDGANAGEVHDDSLVFPKLLQSQLKSRINQVVLGRLTQGQGKPGQSAPWLLAEPTAQDIQAGMQAWERIQSGGQQAPVQQQAPAAQQAPQATTLQPQAQPAAQQWAQPAQQAQAPVQQAPAQQQGFDNSPPF